MSETSPDLERIFMDALEIEDVNQRAHFLDRECGGNSELRKQVEELLAANSDMSKFLEETQTHQFQPHDPMPIGSKIGKYKLMELIGQGGMGIVYVARQELPVKRDVALKVIRPGMDTNEVLARFEQERQALAMMDHPNIAKVLDAGATDNGRPYFVMELVRGIKITEFCDQHRLSNSKRLELFTDVCRAIQHAHQKGVIHRDIKPENILVASYDGKPVTKVIDFGIAKATTEKLTERTVYTQFNQLIGTPMYMSPEQAELSGIDIDTRTDIYSLGVLLYELLTGHTPFDKRRLINAAFDEIRKIICEEIPQRPSKRISQLGATATTISENRQTNSRRLSQSLHRDIDWIVMKALEKDRERRYETANGLANDIRRFLNCEPVLAGPPSLTYQLERFSRRNAKLMTAVAAVAVVVALASIWFVRNDRNLRADGLVNTLLQAKISSVPSIVNQFGSLRPWIEPKLRDSFLDSHSSRDQRLRAGIALAEFDDSKQTFLLNQLQSCRFDEFPVVVESLKSLNSVESSELANSAIDQNLSDELRFQSFCALANFDPDHKVWSDPDNCEFVTNFLVGVLPSELADWRSALAPVKDKLIPCLTKIFVDKDDSPERRLFANVTLAFYGQDNPSQLFEWLALSNEKQFETIFDKLRMHREAATNAANDELIKPIATELSEQQKDQQARRRANAAICLIRLDQADNVWPIFRHSADPRIRSFIVNTAARLNCDPQIFIDRYFNESDISAKRAIVQAIGEFGKSDFAKDSLQDFLGVMEETFRSSPDPGLHSSARWLLTQFDQLDQIRSTTEQAATNLKFDLNKKQWSHNSQGHVFVVFDVENAQMGSPETETERIFHEYVHQRKMNRRFAIATTEVTRRQWQQFITDPNSELSAESEFVVKYSPDWDGPMTAITWFNVANYCNWLSEQEGIPKDQWCFEPNEAGQYNYGTKLKDNFLELSGYRVPTESEWEYMARAGTKTSRYFGESHELLEEYAWYQPNSKGHMWKVGLKKPNDFGFFDVYGNAFEWCVGQFEMWLDDNSEPAPPEDDQYILTEPVTRDFRVAIRGGAWSMPSLNARSAYRNGVQPDRAPNVIGFRLAKSVVDSEID